MNSAIRIVLLLIIFFPLSNLAQESEKIPFSEKDVLFSDNTILPIKLEYSIKELKRQTDDSTYISSVLKYQNDSGEFTDLNVELRKRGNNRLENCYYPPLKIKIKKSEYKGTLFDTHKRLKLVVPCLTERDKNDNVVKEYLAYQIFQLVSPYYFKTRMVDLEFNEVRGNGKIKTHNMMAFLVEDDKHVAKRHEGKIYERKVHPMQMEDMTSVRHSIFQFLIGNTDYSQPYLHNVKVMFLDKEFIPIPYDFDMAGIVNCSYAVVSQIGNDKLPIDSVKDRMFRGYKRNPAFFEQVRQEFLSKQNEIMNLIDSSKGYFQYETEYETCREYVMEFFKLLADDEKFKSQILGKARTTG